MRGVAGPQSDVKSEMPFVPGALFRKFSARRCPVPAPGAEEPDRRTSSRPSSVIPALERVEFGGVASTPSRRRIPLGRPSASEKKSPLTPTVVACVASRRCIAETVSRWTTDSFESTGRSR